MKPPIRVLIVDDSPISRDLLAVYLQQDPQIDVVGQAQNGQQAVEMTALLSPNIITMDLNMPIMDGITAIKTIMQTKAVPILVVSSVTDAKTAYEALFQGALDVIIKPDYSSLAAQHFAAKVKMLAGVAVFTRPKAQQQCLIMPNEPVSEPPQKANKLFVIACSTGGPQVLATLLQQLPTSFNSPIVISQHIADGFAPGLAKWLASYSKLPVELAQEGQSLAPGCIYISPSEQNLVISAQHKLQLKPAAEKEHYHPRCDLLLQSAAQVYGENCIGIILTGMGRDGADGMAAIHQAGGMTLGQDKDSSIIYGMNQVAINAGSVREVLPPIDIAKRMIMLDSSR